MLTLDKVPWTSIRRSFMNEINIGAVILDLRKKLGMTQE